MRYSPTTGRVILQHTLPSASQTDHNKKSVKCQNDVVQAHVSLDLIGSEFSCRDAPIGTWVHVVGYVETNGEAQHKASCEEDQSNHSKFRLPSSLQVNVKALIVWNAGSLDVSAYESSVRARQQSGKLMEPGG